MNNNVLVINCGSSSIKFGLIEAASGKRLISGLAERLGDSGARVVWKTQSDGGTLSIPDADHAHAIQAIVEIPAAKTLLATPPMAIGHRVVHGGEQFSASTQIDAAVLTAIEDCSNLAPLHNPANIVGINAAMAQFPAVPQVAVFDTAFHQTIPNHAYMYAVPYEWYDRLGVRRYGFHGTSHRFVTQRAAEILGLEYENSSFISAHLGNGCSAAAVRAGRSVDTTMGMTPLEGLMMGTRSGNVDPALHQFIAQALGMTLEQVTTQLNKHSGLLGVSGVSNDMRTLFAAAADGNERAALAIEMFCFRLARGVAALTASLNQIDALIFTGGIGENSAPIREKCIGYLQLLNFELDPAQNAIHGRGRAGNISTSTSTPVLVIPTDEEWMISQDCAALIGR